MLLALLPLLVACKVDDSDTEAVDTDVDTEPTEDECLTDSWWTDGDRESPLMHPGGNCIDCHERERGPDLVIAGTVYEGYHQADDCNGIRGVTVEVRDASGAVRTKETNDAGNFYWTARELELDPPYTVRLLIDDKVVASMASEQTDPNCMNCHTQEGANDAPGRIRVPPQ